MIAAIIAAAALTTGFTPYSVFRPTVPDAEPALFVVNDEDTVIYLFGTFHALDGRSDWFNDEVHTAFAGSDELVLETLVPGRTAPGVAREDRASPTSFLSASRMAMAAGRSQGMSTDRGADAVLRNAAEGSGKRVGALESFEFQLRMFERLGGAGGPTDPQLARQAKAALGALLTQLQSAWNRGEVESFTPMLERMRARSPDAYRVIFTDRNRRWADWITHRLQQPGVVFLAVGAGHLAGKDSVQHKLAEAGFRTERVN